MKWMMWSVALMAVAVLPVTGGAQKAKGDNVDKKAMKDSSYFPAQN
jgi:hypothetical protein